MNRRMRIEDGNIDEQESRSGVGGGGRDGRGL